jgi:hypothetical protein
MPAGRRDHEGGTIDLISTGPPQCVGWQADSNVRLKRFPDCVPDARQIAFLCREAKPVENKSASCGR